MNRLIKSNILLVVIILSFCFLLYSMNKPASHVQSWDRTHRIDADRGIEKCVECHSTREFCIKCHNNSASFFVHDGNYEITHKYDANIRIRRCKACHSERKCKNCHAAKRVNPVKSLHRNIHPAGWLTIGSPDHHRRKARQRLTGCTSCHSKNACIFCHNTRRR